MNTNTTNTLDLGDLLISAFSNVSNNDAGSRFMRRSTITRPFSPDCDVLQNDDEMIIFVDLCGVEKSSINIEFQNNKVIISGEKTRPYNNETHSLKLNQLYYGRFSKTIRIPIVITNPESVVRSYENGLLTIKILFNIERENFFSLNI